MIPAAGGAPTPVTELAQGEATHRWPQILPGGKAVLFTSSTSAFTGFDGANIEVVSLADHQRKTLQRGGTFGRYLPASNGNGHLVYINKGTLFAVPFDPGKLEVRGTPSPVLEEVAYSTISGSAQFDFSRNGTLVYRSGGATQANLVTVQWLDAAGKTQPLLAKPGVYRRPRLSPDGERLALDDGSDIWVYEARRDTMTRLTFGGGRNIAPVWSPDGRYIAFNGPGGIWWVRSDGAGKPQPLIQGKNQLVPFSFSPDGKRLAYNEAESEYRVRPLDGDHRKRWRRAAGRKTGDLPANFGGRAPTRLFSRRPLAGLYIQRVRDISSVCAGVPGQGRKVADLERGRRVPDLVEQRP